MTENVENTEAVVDMDTTLDTRIPERVLDEGVDIDPDTLDADEDNTPEAQV